MDRLGSHTSRKIGRWQLKTDRFVQFILSVGLTEVIYDLSRNQLGSKNCRVYAYLPIGYDDVFETPVTSRTIFEVAAVAQPHQLPSIKRLGPRRRTLQLRKRATSYAHGHFSVADEGTGQRDDRCSVTNQQNTLVLPFEATFELRNERGKESFRPVMNLGNVLAFA